jgi:hypothetical protein
LPPRQGNEFNLIVRTIIKGLSSVPVAASPSPPIGFLLIMVNVNSIIVAAEKTINTFSAKSDKSNKVLQSGIVRAEGHLAYLRELLSDFHDKIEEFGPEKPAKYLDGHEFTIRNRCFGDGRDPNDCGRWYVKVSTLVLSQQAIHYI